MADPERPDDKPAAEPTAAGRVQNTVVSAEIPLGTMQMPRGGFAPETPSDTQRDAPARDPLLPTMMPTSATRLTTAPPSMPADHRYALAKEIARGGMGRVVEANDSVLGRIVAVKEVLSMDPETVRRFQRETRITARLEHPAIVPVHDAGVSANGAPFYVMRKVGGRALEDLVARADTLPKRLALVPHIVAASNAIAHAHERGIVHRDIKPANILCGDLGETVVIDWGLAKAIGEAEDAMDPVQRIASPRSSASPGSAGTRSEANAERRSINEPEDSLIQTRAGIVFGTPGFMAPEQLRGKPVDERCDVYALGATLFHMLVRRPPHHHKNADVMMRNAVDGPAPPLLEVLPEVPPELATIVDKALAHDAKDRYQTARALAEDLQSFLTGKLVGSHQYTTSERLVRFYNQNKAAVTIGAVALIAGLVGTVFAFVRITDERDRADEQAVIANKEKAEADTQRDAVMKQARELTLTNARHAASTDPTRALAMVKPLAKPGLVGTDLWRDARDVGAAARAHGVAFSIPMSKHTLTLELSRDGQRALTASDDGKVRIVDIEKRTSKEIANMGGAVMARFADGERKVLIYQGSRLTIIDTATNAKREVTAPTSITKLETSGPLAYWVDPANAAWRLDLAGGAAEKVELGEPIVLVSPSPDGRWVVYGGKEHLLLADRSNPTMPPENKVEGIVHLATWSSDSKHLAALVDDEVVAIKMNPVPQIWNRYRAPTRYGLAFSGSRVFSSGPQGVDLLLSPDPKLRIKDPGHTLGVHTGRENVVISGNPQGELVVLSDYGDHMLTAPLPIERVATSARGEWIVAAAEGMLLVWNLEQFEPRSFSAYPPASARFITGDTMLLTYQNESAEWIDLRTGKATELGELPGIERVVAAPDGAEAIALDITRRAWRIAGIGQPQALPGEVDAVAYIDNTRLVLAGDGNVRLEDLQKRTQGTLLAHKAAVRDLVATWSQGGWIAASFVDGLVWRKPLAGVEQTLQLAAPLPTQVPLALSPDGTVLIGAGNELLSWRTDGKSEVIAKLDKPIFDLVLIAPTTALVLSEDGAGTVIDVSGKRVIRQLPMSPHASPASEGALIAGSTVIGGVEVIDPLVGWRWALTSPQKGVQQQFTYVEMARDGSRVLGVTPHAVVVWTLQLPASADETETWLDKTTNATADTPSGPLGWR